MATTFLDYAGRRVDVLALRGAQEVGEVQLDQTLFDEESAGEICTGIQKLAQRWTIEFLTENGSMRFLPNRGCRFMTDVRLGRLRTEAEVETSFLFSMVPVGQNLTNEEDEEMATDERFASAELLAIAIQPGYLSLSVKINSQAGTSRKVILPLAITV